MSHSSNNEDFLRAEKQSWRFNSSRNTIPWFLASWIGEKLVDFQDHICLRQYLKFKEIQGG